MSNALSLSIKDDELSNRLSELVSQDPRFYSVRGEPGGTVIANSKGSLKLPGVRIRLGSKFNLEITEDKPSAPRPVKGFRTPSIKKGKAKPKKR